MRVLCADEQAGGNVCDPEQVKTLMELGFSEGKVKSALHHCSDPETAAILLLVRCTQHAVVYVNGICSHKPTVVAGGQR